MISLYPKWHMVLEALTPWRLHSCDGQGIGSSGSLYTLCFLRLVFFKCIFHVVSASFYDFYGCEMLRASHHTNGSMSCTPWSLLVESQWLTRCTTLHHSSSPFGVAGAGHKHRCCTYGVGWYRWMSNTRSVFWVLWKSPVTDCHSLSSFAIPRSVMHLFYSILLRHPNHTAWCLCLESHEVRDGCIFSHFLPLYNLYRDHIESERNSHCGSKQHKTSCGWWSGTQTSASHEFSCRGGLLDCLKLETAERHLKFHCKGSPHVKQWQNIRHLLPRIMLLYAYMAPAPATAPAAAPPTAYIAMFAFEFGGFATPEYP